MNNPQKQIEKELENAGIKKLKKINFNLSPAQLIKDTLLKKEGILTDKMALACSTGEFTGRSPKDKFIVKDELTEETVWWGEINHPFLPKDFDDLYNKVCDYLEGKEVYVRDAFACASEKHKLNLRIVTENPWQDLFSHHLFLRPKPKASKNIDWTILAVPGFKADPKTDHTRQHNFTIINFTRKIILIGGSAYTGEIKKGVFTVLNFLLPFRGVLSMHCSANVGRENDTAIFFGLSGTGKTTLSADPERKLIGDDEHGWDENTVFNFEGGCYAKCVNLSEEKEPQIYSAIREDTLLENVGFFKGTNKVDFDDISVTENTRAAYPIYYIDNIVNSSTGSSPKNIFFLTCDAFGVLPPISKLTIGQAMYHFISGYTAKVAGTETGIKEPQTTFSACFGEPFLPLHPIKYAELLGEKLKERNVNVWLINTGWSGGSYGVGERTKLVHTRAMITAALEGKLDESDYEIHSCFGLKIPKQCEGVPANILNPKNTWQDKQAYDETARQLAKQFIMNFEKYRLFSNEEILSSEPAVEKTEMA